VERVARGDSGICWRDVMWSVWLGETVVSAGAAIVSGIFPDDSSALLEEELQQVDTERLLCNLDDACELRDAVDLLSRASQRKPLALLPQLESLWYRVLLASVRSPDPRTHRQGAKALSVMTEPLSGLQKRVHSHIVSGLTDWNSWSKTRDCKCCAAWRCLITRLSKGQLHPLWPAYSLEDKRGVATIATVTTCIS
jgi:hypothetical protein